LSARPSSSARSSSSPLSTQYGGGSKCHRHISYVGQRLSLPWKPKSVSYGKTRRRWPTGWMTGVRFPAGEIFLCSTASRPPLGLTQRALPPEVNRSPPPSTEIKNCGAISNSTPQYVFMAWCLIN
jgi:hypothetical protein